MRTRLPLALALALLGAACSPPPPPPPPPPAPPQVFLLLPDSNVVGTGFKMSVNVVGCEKVENLSILQEQTLIRRFDYKGNPTEVELTYNDLGNFYSSLRIASDLTLVAKATCDDGRSNTSQPQSLKYFPVESVLDVGVQAAPDSFVAEGGLGAPPIFLGCAATQSGNVLAVLNTQGQVIGFNPSPPFQCDYYTTITDKNAVTGKRWVMEPGKGVYAVLVKQDYAVEITSVHVTKPLRLSVAPNGDAIVYSNFEGVQRISHVGPNNKVWSYVPGSGLGNSATLMADPVYRPNLNQVSVAVFNDILGQYNGIVAVEQIDWNTGQKVPAATPTGRYELVTLDYGELNQPVIPPAVFSEDGAILYFSFQTASNAGGGTSAIRACPTNIENCAGANVRWDSPILQGVTAAVVPFANHTKIAAISANRLWFLSSTNGGILNVGGKPIMPDGSLVAHGAQPGIGSDFYLLAGPRPSAQGVNTFPIEIIAVDAPETGEVFRYQMNGGQTPNTALTVGLDSAGLPWMRIGLRLVKPFKLSAYRQIQGPNP